MADDETEQRQLDDDELEMASWGYMLEGKAFAPATEYQDACERLFDRGWLDRGEAEIDGEAEPVEVYSLTTTARTAMEMAGLMQTASASVN